MAAKAAFGQRGAGRQMPAAANAVYAAPQPAALPLEEAAPRVGADADIPVATIALVALLTLIFWAEVNLAGDFAQPLTPSRQASQILGAIDGRLVFQAGEWWRLFTAPVLKSYIR